jgi:hypothetical protein
MRIDANRPARQPRPKLGPFLATLGSWLEVEATLPTRERRTTQRLHDALCLEGDTGAVDAVRRHIRAFECRHHPSTTAFIPQIFPLSEAYQFEWSHDHVELGGIEQVVKVAHVRLCHSCAFFLAAYPRQSQEIVFDSHARAVAIFVGRARRYNRRFPMMCDHYLIEPRACTPASSWEKGQVENQVGNLRG